MLIEAVLIYGAVEGAIYALLAIGFSLVYGVGGILNLAHGAFYLIAAYSMLWLIPLVGVPASILFSLFLTTIIGGLAYILLIKPLQKTVVGVVIVTFGLAFLMEQIVKVIETARVGNLDSKLISIRGLTDTNVTFLGVNFPPQWIVAFVGSILVVFFVTVFMSKAKIGKSIRAVAEDREAAMLMGINADRILLITVALSAFLAGIAAVLYVPASSLNYYMGWEYLLVAFSVVILGGMGSLPGSILGAFIIAYARNFCLYFINSALVDVITVIVILVVLVVRPRGLLGKKEVE